MSATADAYGAERYGGATFAGFDFTSPADRAAALAFRDRLIAIGFGPGRAAALFGLADLADVRTRRAAYYDAFVLPHDAAGAAARFFVLHEAQSEDALRVWLGDDAVALLRRCAALVPAGDRWRSLISVSWFAGNLIVADARAYNLVWPRDPFPDYVMPPGGDSLGLWHVAPRTPRRSALDLCCGPGTQTLAMAAYAETVTGVDRNPRALRFARFNAAANACAHVRFIEGDCYEPLGALRFDAIVANPPFVPWPANDDALYYRGGGERGDDVLATILRGAADHLRPDGTLALCADLADVDNVFARIRSWQGEARRTLLLVQHAIDLLTYAETHAAHVDDATARETETVRLLRHLHAVDIRTLDFGYIVQDARSGRMQLERTGAPANTDCSADVAAWFGHQRLIDDAPDGTYVLAPQLRLVDLAEREPDGTAAASCYIAPAGASVHGARPVSRAAFALLIAAANGGIVASTIEADALPTFAELVGMGLLRASGARAG